MQKPPTPSPAATVGAFRPWATALALASLLALPGCAHWRATAAPDAAWPDRLQALLPADVLLLGEQHDAADHQRLQREAVLWLAARNQFAALVLEMADRGHTTVGLPPGATEAEVQKALGWNNTAWPWKAYGPVVMAAVRAGAPVLGGNLPRSRMRAAMGETAWDQHLPTPALQRQYAALRDGHCGLLPETQIAPMARIQIARDASMAQTVEEALRPGQTVVLVAGGGHVLRSLGVPTHWSPKIVSKVALAHAGQALPAINFDADAIVATPAPPAKDHCAELRKQWAPSAPAPSAPQ